MKESIETISGPVRKGSRIRILNVDCKTNLTGKETHPMKRSKTL